MEVSLEDVDLTEAKLQVDSSEVKTRVAEANEIKIHTKANIKTIAIKVTIIKAIKVYIIIHIEISKRMCDQNCYTKTQQKQQDQSITPCTHAYDHITQHINNLEDPTQPHTLYTQEVDASLFTTDTATLCDYNITDDISNSDTIQEIKSKITQPMGIHSQSRHKYRNIFGDSNIQYHDFNNGDALTFKDKYTALLQQELQNPYWCLHDPITTKSYQISSKMDIEKCHIQFIFLVIRRSLLKLIKFHTR